MTGSMYDYTDVVLSIDSGASKHFISDIDQLISWDLEARNVTFNTAVGTTITSHARGTITCKTYDTNHEQRVATLCGAYYPPHQPHNIVVVDGLLEIPRHNGNRRTVRIL